MANNGLEKNQQHFNLLLSKIRETPKFDPIQHKDQTRATIAKIFTWGFFFLVAVTLIGAPIYNALFPTSQIDMKDILVTISGVIGGPFGFVVGYYFKGSEKGR